MTPTPNDHPTSTPGSFDRHTTEAVIVVDELGRCVACNGATTRVLGYSELIGTQVLALVHPDDQRLLPPQLVTTPKTVRFRHADGTWRYAQMTGDFDHQHGAVVVVLRDVTAEHARLEAMNRQASLDDLIRRTSIAFVAIDANRARAAMVHALGDIARACGADRAAFVRFADPDVVVDVSWAASGVAPVDPGQTAERLQRTHPMYAGLHLLAPVRVNSLDELARTSPLDAADLRRSATRSLLVVPFGHAGRLAAAVLVETVHAEHAWTDGDERVLWALAALLTQARGRHDTADLSAERGAGDYNRDYNRDCAVLDLLPDALVRVALDHTFMPVNRAGAAVLSVLDQYPEPGRPLDHPLGPPIDLRIPADALPPTLATGWLPVIDRCFTGERGAQLSASIEWAERGWMESAFIPEVDDEGRVETVLIVTRQQAADAAVFDPLTNLPNRVLFKRYVEHSLSGLSRRPSLISVLFIDLDGFKQVNDSIGHHIGDELLLAVTHRLRTALRPEDVVARQSGDEFVVLLENQNDGTEAVRTAERLLETIRRPVMLSGHEVTVGASIGVAVTSESSVTADELIRQADQAMYQAKARGRGRVEVFDDVLASTVAASRQLSTGLRSAIDRNEFEVHYQPVNELESGLMVGIEALLRWRHPTLGLIDAAEFVELADIGALMQEIGRRVMVEATGVAQSLNRLRPQRPLTVHVNISQRQLHHAGLLAGVDDALAASGLDPQLLLLEVTERVLMDDQAAALRFAGDMHRRGVRVAIDNFGTAKSSVVHLGRLGLDLIKIDRGVVARLPNDASAVAAVRSMVALAGALGLRITAEGIETGEQAASLASLGCPQGQGYWFSRATPAALLPPY
jgi:diguanylate cyclase (GGDEF)-like protein/PAS domain S-box-containing protein